MENKIIKCTSKNHENIDAVVFCQECQIYICAKCEQIHSSICQNHTIFKLENKNIKHIFTGFCKEGDHKNRLEYYCRTHNQLCCVACIANIKGKGNGQHSGCEIVSIEEIKDEKKDKLQEHLKYLEDISKTIEESIKKLKNISEEINTKKEILKKQVQSIFTKIRNSLNAREDEILLEIDKKFDEHFFKEDLVKESEKLPKKVKFSLENGKNMNSKWDDDKNLNYLIHQCINIEDSMNKINYIDEEIKKNMIINKEINFITKEYEIIDSIKKFGNINVKIDDKYNEEEKKEKVKEKEKERVKERAKEKVKEKKEKEKVKEKDKKERAKEKVKEKKEKEKEKVKEEKDEEDIFGGLFG